MNVIRQYINGLKDALDTVDEGRIQTAIDILHVARLQGKKIFILGNGGSATTASHFVCDLAKNTRVEGLPSFKVIGLADNMALFSAYANDEGYEQVFAQQLATLMTKGDIVIAISASGNSANVLNCVRQVNEVGGTTIGFTGFDGGLLSKMVDVNLHVDCVCIEQVEDVHLALEHLIVCALRELKQSIGTSMPRLPLKPKL